MKRDTSALLKRPNFARQAAGRLGEVLGGLVRPLLKDRLSAFLIVASTILTILFFTFLGDTKPSSPGDEVPLSTVTALSEQKAVVNARLLDYDARVVIKSADQRELWAA